MNILVTLNSNYIKPLKTMFKSLFLNKLYNIDMNHIIKNISILHFCGKKP